MAVSKHLDEAAARLKDASTRIEAARMKPLTLENAGQWIGALTDFTAALADIQAFNNESIHEKLHELADRLNVKSFPVKRGAH